MNKQLFKLTTAIIFGLFHYTSMAQSCALSGTYTINADLPADSVNFTSFTDAVNGLNNCGVSGSVVFNVAAGLYKEQIVIGDISGSSINNSITFQADPLNRRKVNLSYKASHPDSNYVIRFLSSSYITIRGLNVSSKDSTNGKVIDIVGAGEYLSIENNNFFGILSPSVDPKMAVIGSEPGSEYDYIKIEGNTISNGSFGLLLEGAENNKGFANMIMNNKVYNYGFTGIATKYQDSIIVKNNIVQPSSVATAFICIGIVLENGAHFIMSHNKIMAHDLSPVTYGVQGISIIRYDSSITHANANIVSNNIVNIQGNLPIGGSGISAESFKLQLIYNSIIATPVSAQGINIPTSYTNGEGSVTIFNNNISTPGGGIPITIGALSNNNDSEINYNNFYTTGSVLGSWGGGATGVTATDLAEWQSTTSMDANSVSVDPQFINPDLRVYISAMNNLGTPVTGITTDIEGNTRSTTTPDIGAYEFTAYNEDLFITELLSPVDSICGDSNTTVSVVIFNRGANDASGFDVGAIISGQDISTIYSGTLSSGTGDTVGISGFNTVSGEMTEIQTYTSLSSDMNTANDTLSTMVYIQNSIALDPITSKGYFCADEPYDTLYFPEGVSAYQWLTTDGDTIGSNDGLVVGPLNSNDTTFILSPIGNNCNAPDGSITLEYIPAPLADFNSILQGPTETDFTVEFDAAISENGDFFEWNFGDGNTVTGDSVNHTYTADSTYEVQLIVTGACGSDTIVKTVEIEGISITENILAESLKLYPNPAKDRLNLSFKSDENGSIQILDLSGKVLTEQSYDNTKRSYEGQIDMSMLPKGSYLLKIGGKDIEVTKRIIKN